jgi:hypothetical protein
MAEAERDVVVTAMLVRRIVELMNALWKVTGETPGDREKMTGILLNAADAVGEKVGLSVDMPDGWGEGKGYKEVDDGEMVQ